MGPIAIAPRSVALLAPFPQHWEPHNEISAEQSDDIYRFVKPKSCINVRLAWTNFKHITQCSIMHFIKDYQQN